MLFSIIIPTYNPISLIERLLDSITHNYCRDEIEIILADDRSTQDIYPLIGQFDLTFKIIENDQHYGAPSYGRENGRNEAIGRWLCFADQDDYFEDNIFDNLKQFILKGGPHNYIETNIFYEFPDDNGHKILPPLGHHLTHGKFYEKTFLDKNNIHYDRLMTGEDTNFQTKVVTTLMDLDAQVSYFSQPSYTWVQRSNSLSKNNDGSNAIAYFSNYFLDYVKGSLGYYCTHYEEQIKNNKPINQAYYKIHIEYCFIFCYCYLSSIEHSLEITKAPIQDYYKCLKKYFQIYLKLFNTSTDQYLALAYNELFEEYNNIYSSCQKQYQLMPRYSFYDWVYKYLD